ncbi:MAG: GNAT family N-acetyltransferase [Alphaproteobacteria bacterium]|nr:GNAT family N-acetyltransferase [Alphaproteobacteria bacterium]
MTIKLWREEAIQKKHDRKGFDCGQGDLNSFLAQHARQAHESGASKTYVVVDPDDGVTIYGFYTLVPTDMKVEDAPSEIRLAGGGNHSIGGFRLARLAVSKRVQGQGIGGKLLLSAARRCMRVSEEVGGTMIVIDAKDDKAASWYKIYGAIAVPRMPLTLVLPYSVIQKSFAKAEMILK